MTNEIQSWRPVEQYPPPEDGTPILGCREDCYAPTSVYFGYYHPNQTGKKEWRTVDTKVKVSLTHWMPLPQPPKKAGEL